MHRALASAVLSIGLVACSPYAKRDKDDAKKAAQPQTAVPAQAQPATGTATSAQGAGQLAAGQIAAQVAGQGAVRTATLAAQKAALAAPAKEEKNGLLYTSVRIDKSVEDALTAAIGKDNGTPLSQIAIREIVWWIDVRKEFRKGDHLELVYEVKGTEQDPVVLHALWFQSQKLGKTMAAVSYKAKDQPFARWYLDDGQEVEERLEGGPIDTYEQVTSLLNDGRRHKGVDFKAPVGTPVKAAFDGVIVKKNWKRGNGNCLEIEDAKGGIHAKFLHLDHIDPQIGVGTRVKAGQVIARSGNTGHSTAPHLHYQLESGSRLVDPFKFHKTYRTKLAPEEAARAKAELDKLAAMRKPQ